MTPKTQSVCKHCRKVIEEKQVAGLGGTAWLATDGTVFCQVSADSKSLKGHEPVAEPASTGEPELAEIKTEDYWIAACLHILLCPWTNCGVCNRLRVEIEKEHPNVKAI